MSPSADRPSPRTRHRETIHRAGRIIGLISWHTPTIGLYPYHVVIETHAGPQYLGVCATLRDARRVVRDNT